MILQTLFVCQETSTIPSTVPKQHALAPQTHAHGLEKPSLSTPLVALLQSRAHLINRIRSFADFFLRFLLSIPSASAGQLKQFPSFVTLYA